MNRTATGKRSVLMVGTHPTTMGGISSVVRGYRDAGLFERFPCEYLVTHRDGSGAVKARTALSAYLRVALALAGRRVALIHVHMSSRASFWRKAAICMMALVTRRPYIIHMHGSEFMRFHDIESGRLSKTFIRFILRRAALVLALSQQWSADLKRISPAARTEVFTNAVALPPDRGEAPSADTAPTILFLGRLGERKGTFDLVRAFAEVAHEFPSSRLVCAGDGMVESVLALARELGVESQIECPGWISPDKARELLAAADIFTLPSYAEGLPMALLEAMSWALPVVTTPVGGIPQVVQHETNGLLVAAGAPAELAAALRRLCMDPALRRRLGDAARATIEKSFSLNASIDHLGKIYARFGICERRPAAA